LPVMAEKTEKIAPATRPETAAGILAHGDPCCPQAQGDRCDRRSVRLFILRGVPAHIRSDNGPEFVAHTASLLMCGEAEVLCPAAAFPDLRAARCASRGRRHTRRVPASAAS
jgi:hypothetical protein